MSSLELLRLPHIHSYRAANTNPFWMETVERKLVSQSVSWSATFTFVVSESVVQTKVSKLVNLSVIH